MPRMDRQTLGCSGDADPGLTPELAVGVREGETPDFDSLDSDPRPWEDGARGDHALKWGVWSGLVRLKVRWRSRQKCRCEERNGAGIQRRQSS